MTPSMIEHHDRIEFYPTLWRSAFVIALCAFFVCLGIYMAMHDRSHSWKDLVFLYALVPLAGVNGLFTAFRLIGGRPTLVIDSTGITDSTSSLGTMHVGWEEVDHLLWFKTRRGSGLQVVPKSVGAFWRSRGSAARFLFKLRHPMGEAAVTIGDGMLAISATELADLLHARYGVRIEGRDPMPANP